MGRLSPTLMLLILPLAEATAVAAGGVLCFDEAHRNVHRADGTYEPVVRLAAQAGLSLRLLEVPWSPRLLAGCEVVLTAGPRGAGRDRPLVERGQPAFSATEVEAVAGWVADGGGLLLVTDHAPIGGAAAPLAEWLGVEMSDAFTEDPERGSAKSGELVFARGRGLASDHPITRGRSVGERIERVSTFVGQSLDGPPGSHNLLALSASARDRRRRSPDGFTWADPTADDPLIPAGGRSQALAMVVGEGRVVVLGEAAMLTGRGLSAGAEKRGNRQFAFNVLRWLAGHL